MAEAATSSAQHLDPGELQAQGIAAVNAGDLETAVSLLADDVVFAGSGNCFPAACTGKDAIRKEITEEIALHTHVTRISYTVDGNVVSGRLAVTNDATRAAGIERLISAYFEIWSNGKNIANATLLDKTDPETARFLAAHGDHS
jgi:ketosteroid isomerase-like protein